MRYKIGRLINLSKGNQEFLEILEIPAIEEISDLMAFSEAPGISISKTLI